MTGRWGAGGRYGHFLPQESELRPYPRELVRGGSGSVYGHTWRARVRGPAWHLRDAWSPRVPVPKEAERLGGPGRTHRTCGGTTGPGRRLDRADGVSS